VVCTSSPSTATAYDSFWRFCACSRAFRCSLIALRCLRVLSISAKRCCVDAQGMPFPDSTLARNAHHCSLRSAHRCPSRPTLLFVDALLTTNDTDGNGGML